MKRDTSETRPVFAGDRLGLQKKRERSSSLPELKFCILFVYLSLVSVSQCCKIN